MFRLVVISLFAASIATLALAASGLPLPPSSEPADFTWLVASLP
jgi:hypothetical protein